MLKVWAWKIMSWIGWVGGSSDEVLDNISH